VRIGIPLRGTPPFEKSLQIAYLIVWKYPIDADFGAARGQLGGCLLTSSGADCWSSSRRRMSVASRASDVTSSRSSAVRVLPPQTTLVGWAFAFEAPEVAFGLFNVSSWSTAVMST
jgi:hypothetical protein